MRRLLLLLAGLSGCGASPAPPAVAPALPPALPPLPRACQEALPLAQRTVGELVRLVRSLGAPSAVETRPCDHTTSWPVAYRETEGARAPIGVTVLQMEGDALLTLDARERDAPSVKLCAIVEARVGDRHRVRAVALWDSSDERAFDPADLAGSRAELAWLELLSRRPSACALGEPETAPVGDAELAELLRCVPPNFASALPPDCPGSAPADPPQPDARAVERAAAATHRFGFVGRDLVRDPSLRLEAPERCFHEPAPAKHDLCLAEYIDVAGGARWYGRGDVTRTGEAGEKNYVDSYLTFQQLKRLEAQRRSRAGGAPKK